MKQFVSCLYEGVTLPVFNLCSRSLINAIHAPFIFSSLLNMNIFLFSGNMFAGLDIKFNDAVSLPSTHATDEMDRISTVSVSQKNRVGTKKERIKKRRDELLKSKLFITKLLWYFLVKGEVKCFTIKKNFL